MPAKRPWFELRRSKIQGTGAFALRDIPAGQKIIEYTGERITEEEASARYDDSRAKRHHTFLFDLDGKECIDAQHVGSDARFINHSCAPNCEALLEGKRIFIYAKVAIATGTELSYDYQYTFDEPLDAATKRLYACRCGAPTCRGTIAVVKQKQKKRAKKAAKQAKTSKLLPAKKRKRTAAAR